MLRISESTTHGALPSVVLENDAVRVTVLPGRGGEIHQIRNRASGLEYLLVDAAETERFAEDLSAGTAGRDEDYLFNGFLTMFPNAGTAAQVDGRDYEFHGDIRHVAWDYRIGHDEPDTPIYLSGRSRSVPAVLNRRLALDSSRALISVTDELVFVGDRDELPIPYIYGLHPYFGRPLLDEGTQLRVGAQTVATLPSRSERVSTLYDAAESVGLVEVYNPKLDAGFRLTYEPDQLPYVWVWLNLDPSPEGPYVTALLPCTNTWDGGITTALELGTAQWLRPGEPVSYSWQLELY